MGYRRTCDRTIKKKAIFMPVEVMGNRQVKQKKPVPSPSSYHGKRGGYTSTTSRNYTDRLLDFWLGIWGTIHIAYKTGTIHIAYISPPFRSTTATHGQGGIPLSENFPPYAEKVSFFTCASNFQRYPEHTPPQKKRKLSFLFLSKSVQKKICWAHIFPQILL